MHNNIKQLRLGAKDKDIEHWLEGKSFSSYVKYLIRKDMQGDSLEDIKQLYKELQDIKEMIGAITIVAPAAKEAVEEVAATKIIKSKKSKEFII